METKHRIKDFFVRMRHKFYKKVFRLFNQSSKSHIRDFWPSIKAVELEQDRFQVSYKGKPIITTQSFDALKCNTSEDIYIIGSGPSISKQNLDKLNGKSCILLNGACSLLKEYPNLNIFMYAVIDSSFIVHRFKLLKYLPKGSNLLLSLGAIRAIAERDMRLLKENNIYLANNILKPFDQPVQTIESVRSKSIVVIDEITRKFGFSLNPNNGFFDAGTIMTWALQICVFMSFKEIYLLGFDIANASEPRFYESKKNRLKTGLLNDYEEKILPFMRLVSHICAEKKISIYNCSPLTLLPYDVIPFSDKFQ